MRHLNMVTRGFVEGISVASVGYGQDVRQIATRAKAESVVFDWKRSGAIYARGDGWSSIMQR